MDPQPAFTFQDLFTFVIGDMAKSVADREGETQEQQFARSRAAVHMILGFQPRDVIEAMLAGHCVMLHEVMTANVSASLSGGADSPRRGPRSNVTGLNKAFNDTLDRLERYRERPAEGTRDGSEEAVTTPEASGPMAEQDREPQQDSGMAPPLNRAARRQANRAGIRAAAAAARTAARPVPVHATDLLWPDQAG